MKSNQRSSLMLALSILACYPLGARESPDFAGMSLEELLAVDISIATGIAQPISEAPAVVTVITAGDISEMGATTLAEALEVVPGIHMAHGHHIFPRVVTARGLRHILSSNFLFLVNGKPVRTAVLGSYPVYASMLTTSIARIEVIRGPGSAVYGADAFAGVINIITKTSEDLDGVELGFRMGSSEYRNGWVRYGGKLGGWDLSLGLEWRRSNGYPNSIIESDFQSLIDSTMGTHASLAPGPLLTMFDNLLFDLHLERNNWKFSLWKHTKDDDSFSAALPTVLSNSSYLNIDNRFAEISYRKEIAETWSLTSAFRQQLIDWDCFIESFPPGAVLPISTQGFVDFDNPAGLVLFSEGFINLVGSSEEYSIFENVAVYQGRAHSLRAAIGYTFLTMDPFTRANNGPGVLDVGTVGFPLPEVVDSTLTDLTGTEYAMYQRNDRSSWYVSLQDEWSLSKSWATTVGIRFDHYSDFGNTVNPRLSLVWLGSEKVIAKLIYGSAFRAPSFDELHSSDILESNVSQDLDPERIQTTELVLDYRPSSHTRAVLNLFSSDIKDLIALLPDPDSSFRTYQNSISHNSYGFEVDLHWDVSQRFRLKGNVAWQHSEYKKTGSRVPYVPRQQAFLSARWSPDGQWYATAKAKWIGESDRVAGDPRPASDDYVLVDLTLGRKHIAEHWTAAVLISNVLDTDARDPNQGLALMNDLPLARRQTLLELRYEF